MSTTTKLKTRPWPSIFDLFPGTLGALAESMRCHRNGLEYLRQGQHRRVPTRMLGDLAAALLESGMADGSRPPRVDELVRAWLAEFRTCREPVARGPSRRNLARGRAADSAQRIDRR